MHLVCSKLNLSCTFHNKLLLVTRKTALEGVKIAFHELELSLQAMEEINDKRVQEMEEKLYKEKERRIGTNVQLCRALVKMTTLEEQSKKDAAKLTAYEEEIAELKRINDWNMSRTALWRKIGIIASSPSVYANEKPLEDIERVIKTQPRSLPRRSLPVEAATDSVL